MRILLDKVLTLTLFSASICLATAGIAAPINTISSNGVALATIVLGGQCSEVEKFAASELQKYLKAISGAELPVVRADDLALEQSPSVILIGTPRSSAILSGLQAGGNLPPFTDDDLGGDGYVVKNLQLGKKTILLLGSNHPRGTLFAVYDFLEQDLGVRFYGFGDFGEIVPTVARVEIGVCDRVEKPRFRFRIANDNNFLPTDTKTLSRVADWAVKNRFNCFLLTLNEVSRIATEELTKRGLEIWGGGHVWGQFTPEKAMFETHPEYFPLINGQRNFPGDKQAYAFCYSNPDAMKLFISKACAYARKRPMMTVFACWAEDGSQRWAQCQCEKCKTYSLSDWNLYIVNRIAQAFERDPLLRALRIQWIAYSETSVPPSKVVPYQRGKNIDLLYANGARDYLAPMDSEANRRCASWLQRDEVRKQLNTDYKPNPTDDDLAGYQRLETFLRYLKKAEFEGNICVLEYVNASIGHWLDLPYMQHVQTGPWMDDIFPKDMQYYLSRGIAGWADCYNWPNDVPDAFWNRLMAQVLWDPFADLKGIKEDFYAKTYGAAGSIMQTYFQEVWQMLNREKPRIGDYADLKKLRGLLLKGQKAIGADLVVGNRLAVVIKWHDALRLARISSNIITDGGFETKVLNEGAGCLVEDSGFSDANSDWWIFRPFASAIPQPRNGRNYAKVAGDAGLLTQTSKNYVFEARTFYRLEVDVYSLNPRGSFGLSLNSVRGNNPKRKLVESQLSGLRTNEWTRLAIDWYCHPGSEEENKPIGFFCEANADMLLDNLTLRASSTKPPSGAESAQ